MTRPTTSAKPATDLARENLRRLMAEYGPRAAQWYLQERTESEMVVLRRLTGTPLGGRLADCEEKILNGVQAADLFACSGMRWMNMARQGHVPAAERMGMVERWRRETLVEWAGNGCPSASGKSQSEFLGRGLSTR